MAIIPIPNGPQLVRGGIPTFSAFFNGASPWASTIRRLADFLHMLVTRRGRVLFTKYIKTVYASADTTDRATLRFACHTGPFARTVRIAMTLYPAASRDAGGDTKLYWTMETGLTGSGTTTTGNNVVYIATYAAHAADNFDWTTQEFTVSPDTDYRFVLHQFNSMAVQAVTVYEVTRPVLDTSVDTGTIDTTKIKCFDPITGRGPDPLTANTTHSILALADKIWKRGGHPLFAWNVDGATAMAITATTAANILDSTTTTTSTTMGWPVHIEYSGSLDSSNVGVVFWVNAYVSNAAATGVVALKDQDGNTMASISVTATSATWYSTTANLTDASGSNPTERLEVYASVTSTYQLNLHAAGVFMHVA